MSSPIAEAVELFVERAPEWIRAAGNHATQVAGRAEDGTYASDRDALVADATRTAALVARGWARFASTILDAATIIAIPPNPRPVVRSLGGFVVPGPSDLPRTLAFAEPLTSGFGHVVPDDAVDFDPAELRADVNAFELVVRIADPVVRLGIGYSGVVVATDRDGREQTVEVGMVI
jgi:hypothetical protein